MGDDEETDSSDDYIYPVLSDSDDDEDNEFVPFPDPFDFLSQIDLSQL